MNAFIQINKEFNIAEMIFHGEVTYNDLCLQIDALCNHPQYQPNTHILWNLLDTHLKNIGHREVSSLIAFVKERECYFGEDYKLSLAVDSNLIFGLANMYASLAVHRVRKVSIFKDIEKAKAWLMEK